MKCKKLTNEKLIISIDRLTRFKSTSEKYLRVYLDILSECLVEPKYKKTELGNLDYAVLSKYVSEIINSSLPKSENSLDINRRISEYENSIFINDDKTQQLLDNTINYSAVYALLKTREEVNLKWLKALINGENIIDARKKYKCKFPVEKIMLVEGITEEVLLPKFANVLGYNFDENGVQVISAGGKNQVVKAFYEYSKKTKLPMFVLMDKDGEDNINQIKPKLRSIDKIHLVSCGEFEDMLPIPLITKTLNSMFKNFVVLHEQDLSNLTGMVKQLEQIFKTKGLHEFKKAEFAKSVYENITGTNDISEEIANIIKELKSL